MRISFLKLVAFFILCYAYEANAQDSTSRPFCGFGNARTMQGLSDHVFFKSNNNVNDVGQYFIIPVVVHIIHNGGPENLNDKMVWAANGIYNIVLITPKQTYKQKLVLQHQ
jgi:hypothetical protein